MIQPLNNCYIKVGKPQTVLYCVLILVILFNFSKAQGEKVYNKLYVAIVHNSHFEMEIRKTDTTMTHINASISYYKNER